MVPYVVLGRDCDVNKAVIQLKELLHGTSFESHAKPGSFVLKPAVAAVVPMSGC